MVIFLSVIEIIIITSIIILVLTEPISVKIIKGDVFLLRFNILFFNFDIIPSKNEDKNKNKSTSTLRDRLNKVKTVYRVLALALSRSRLVIFSLAPFLPTPSEKYYFHRGIVNVPRAALYAFLESHSASVEVKTSDFYADFPIFIEINTSLLHLLRTLTFYHRETRRNKIEARTRI